MFFSIYLPIICLSALFGLIIRLPEKTQLIIFGITASCFAARYLYICFRYILCEIKHVRWMIKFEEQQIISRKIRDDEDKFYHDKRVRIYKESGVDE